MREITSNARGYGTTAKGIREIKDAANGLSENSASNLRLVVDALQGLKNLGNIKISSSIAAQIKSIGDATRNLDSVNFEKVKTLSRNLEPLKNIPKAEGLASTINAMRKLPSAIEGINKNLDDETIARFSERVKTLRQVIVPLANEMRAVSAGFSVLPRNIQKAINMTNRFASASENTQRRTNGLLKNLTRIGAAYLSIRSVWRFGMDSFTEANNFVESINLANVAMGEGANEAMVFAKRVEDLIGINMSDWIAQVGTFNQMLAGFGISQKQSAKMSQQLTQLGYDIQSAFNISDLSMVMDRLQSGLAGQIKGMREYGVELSVAAMKEFALERGITKSWTAMNMAEKTALRYAKIMADTSNIQQDLSRTLITPSNALRVLSAQWEVATRYIGQFVSVIATRVIPVVQAAVAAISALAQSLASAWGYVLPDIPTTGIVGGLDDVEDAIDDVGSAAGGAGKELKGMLASWDEINVIQSQSGGGGGGGGSSVVEDMFDFSDLTDYTYDFLDGIKSKTQDITKTIQAMLPWIQTAAAAFGTWVVTDKIMDFLELVGLFKDVAGTGLAWKIPLTVTGLVTGFMLESYAAEEVFKNNKLTLESLIAGALGFVGMTGALTLATGNLGLSATIAAGVTLIAFVNEFRLYKQKEYAQMAADAFAESGKDGVSIEEMIAAVEAEFSSRAGSAKLVIDAYAEVGNYNDALQEATTQIKALNDVIFGDEALTSEQATTFKSAWDTVTATLDSITKADYSTVFQGLVQAAQSSNKQLAEEALIAEQNFYRIQGGYTELQAKTLSEMNNLVDLISTGQATVENKKRYSELLRYFNMSKEEQQAEMAFEDAIRDAANVNYNNMDDVNRYISELTNLYEKNVEINNNALDSFRSAIDDLKLESFNQYKIGNITEDQYQSTIKELDDWLDIYTRDVEIRNEELREQTALLFEGIFEQALQIALEKNFNQGEAAAYVNEFLEPIINAIAGTGVWDETSFRSALDLLQKLRDSVRSFDNLGVRGGYGGGVWAIFSKVKDLNEEYKDATEFNETIKDVLFGINQTNAEVQKLKGNADSLRNRRALEYKRHGFDPLSVALEMENAEKPTQEFKESLRTITDELWGVDQLDATINIDDTAVTEANNVAKELKTELKELDGMEVMITVTYGTGGAGVGSRVPTPTWYNPPIYFPRFADGGIPTTGSLFIANESGPELVGQFGGGTGVANNDQIVAGIASGVAQANSAQNAILREQNDLLRRLLEKEFTAEVTPSVGFGQAAKRSIDMFSKVSGVGW